MISEEQKKLISAMVKCGFEFNDIQYSTGLGTSILTDVLVEMGFMDAPEPEPEITEAKPPAPETHFLQEFLNSYTTKVIKDNGKTKVEMVYTPNRLLQVYLPGNINDLLEDISKELKISKSRLMLILIEKFINQISHDLESSGR